MVNASLQYVAAWCSLEHPNISIQRKRVQEERPLADVAGVDAATAGRWDFMLDRETMQVLEK
jgi:hypothetical protein